jgi:DNA-binding MarR family transcriptional regulator
MQSQEYLPGMLFHELSRIRNNKVNALLAARGLGDLGAPMILFTLKHRGEKGEIGVQRKLSEFLHVSKATIAVSIKSLERGGYVERRPDSQDARRRRIALTAKGCEAVETCMAVYQEVDDKMLCGLTGEEAALLASYLRRMTDNLRGNEAPSACFER